MHVAAQGMDLYASSTRRARSPITSGNGFVHGQVLSEHRSTSKCGNAPRSLEDEPGHFKYTAGGSIDFDAGFPKGRFELHDALAPVDFMKFCVLSFFPLYKK
jgi:hypothetical protein